MNVELEAKLIDINPDEIRTKLKKLGASLIYKERLLNWLAKKEKR